MPIDVRSEKLIKMRLVPTITWLPKGADGKPIHYATAYGWHRTGLKNGRVRLEAISIGGILCTTEEALARFFERLSMPEGSELERTPSEANKAHDRAQKELEAAGI